MSSPDAVLELYKLEYEKAAERYENIYGATWTNFSYMAAVAAGILSFGSSAFQTKEVAVLLACVPLFFWYLATFLPLNKYGDLVSKRLKGIEIVVNEKYGTNLNHFSGYNERITKWHKIFARVRFALLLFFCLLFATAIFLSVRIFHALGKWDEYRAFGWIAIIAGMFVLLGLIRGAIQAVSRS